VVTVFRFRNVINIDAVTRPTFLRLSAGYIYFHFGVLKFYPDLSPGEMIASQSMMKLSMYRIDASTALWWLAVVECAIGLSFLFNIGMRWMFFVFVAHQLSTFVPLFALPEITFKIAPLAPTMEGQYILKNLVSLAAGWTVMFPAVKEAWRERWASRFRAPLMTCPLPAVPVQES
jgi:hypothetical protein